MRYLNENDMNNINIDWVQLIDYIKKAVLCIQQNDYSQPLKPYLRFGDPKNRIIAMPAFVGGEINASGIKWIASFPDNIHRGKKRANCVVILNSVQTGEPIFSIDSGIVSAMRTAAVSGMIIEKYLQTDRMKNRQIKIGVIGLGPIGLMHIAMINQFLSSYNISLFVYDLNTAKKEIIDSNSSWVDTYESIVQNCDIVLTTTVSENRYINTKPKDGALLLNVSLRDYCDSMYQYIKGGIVVDDWEEVCRENTDIELFHKMNDLSKQDVIDIVEYMYGNWIETIPAKQTIMVNPMGMAIFDITSAKYIYQVANDKSIGIEY